MEEERCIWSSKFGGKERVGEFYGAAGGRQVVYGLV